jgi:AraC-like DNA-binding protein
MDDVGTQPPVAPGLYNDTQLAKILLSAHEGAEQKLPYMHRQARWCAAMGLLFGRYARPNTHRHRVGNERGKMALVRDYIAANVLSDISINELLPLCGLSRYHLIRSFTREYGMPPHAYTNQLRLIEAKKALDAGLGAAAAAAAAGFYDQSHLTQLFKRAYCMTPGAYAALRPEAH